MTRVIRALAGLLAICLVCGIGAMLSAGCAPLVRVTVLTPPSDGGDQAGPEETREGHAAPHPACLHGRTPKWSCWERM